MKQYEQIFSKIYGEIRVINKPLIIGISGVYTSGKTTFTKGISEYFNTQGVKTQILHYDDFHYPLSSITWEPGDLADEVEAFSAKGTA